MKSVKHLWASLLIVMAFVIICPTALAATGNSSQIHSKILWMLILIRQLASFIFILMTES